MISKPEQIARQLYNSHHFFPQSKARRTSVARVPIANPHETRRMIGAIRAFLAPEA
jgi:hypothetical protein